MRIIVTKEGRLACLMKKFKLGSRWDLNHTSYLQDAAVIKIHEIASDPPQLEKQNKSRVLTLKTLQSVKNIDTFISFYDENFENEEDSNDDSSQEETESDYQPKKLVQKVQLSQTAMTQIASFCNFREVAVIRHVSKKFCAASSVAILENLKIFQEGIEKNPPISFKCLERQKFPEEMIDGQSLRDDITSKLENWDEDTVQKFKKIENFKAKVDFIQKINQSMEGRLIQALYGQTLISENGKVQLFVLTNLPNWSKIPDLTTTFENFKYFYEIIRRAPVVSEQEDPELTKIRETLRKQLEYLYASFNNLIIKEEFEKQLRMVKSAAEKEQYIATWSHMNNNLQSYVKTTKPNVSQKKTKQSGKLRSSKGKIAALVPIQLSKTLLNEILMYIYPNDVRLNSVCKIFRQQWLHVSDDILFGPDKKIMTQPPEYITQMRFLLIDEVLQLQLKINKLYVNDQSQINEVTEENFGNSTRMVAAMQKLHCLQQKVENEDDQIAEKNQQIAVVCFMQQRLDMSKPDSLNNFNIELRQQNWLEEQSRKESYEFFVFETLLRFEMFDAHVRQFGPKLEEIDSSISSGAKRTDIKNKQIEHFKIILQASKNLKKNLKEQIGAQLVFDSWKAKYGAIANRIRKVNERKQFAGASK